MDWEQNEKKISKNKTIKVSSTPIFLLDDKIKYKAPKTSGFVIFLEVVGIILLIVAVAFVGLYCYKRFVKKKYIPLDKNIISSLLK